MKKPPLVFTRRSLVLSSLLLFLTAATTSIQPAFSEKHDSAADHLPSTASSLQVGKTLLYHFNRELQEDNCTVECCMNNFCEEEAASSPFSGLPQWLSIILIVILISMSALFSGLTLGLMGLDRTGLEIVMESDDAINAKYAKRIYPLRKNGNLLLCTLLLGNTSVNALLSILMAVRVYRMSFVQRWLIGFSMFAKLSFVLLIPQEFTGGTVGFVASTLLILIFGEITRKKSHVVVPCHDSLLTVFLQHKRLAVATPCS